jgi:hypothetical protein
MATRPVACPYDTPEGFRFYRDNLVLDDGTKSSPPKYLSMNDLLIGVESFSKSRVSLNAGESFLLSQSGIGDTMGYVSFIAIKAKFPDNIVESNKYLTWVYKGQMMNMGELMVLSGAKQYSTDSSYDGWNLSKPNEYLNNGGMIFNNPHSDFQIKLEILIGR